MFSLQKIGMPSTECQDYFSNVPGSPVNVTQCPDEFYQDCRKSGQPSFLARPSTDLKGCDYVGDLQVAGACAGTKSDDEEVFELELDWTPTRKGMMMPTPDTPRESLKICRIVDDEFYKQPGALFGGDVSRDNSCKCSRCSGRPNYEVGDSRGIKRSHGASPLSKKVMLAETPVKTPAVLSLPQPVTNLLRCDDVYEYTTEAYKWKQTMEDRYWVGCQMALAIQVDLAPDMRKTLLMWLVAVNRQFNFTLETWCLTVSLLDRFLSIQPLKRDCLQLAGLSAFFIAAKSEEVEPPKISELISLCAGSYDRKQFQWMELIMLSHLRFEILSPTPAFFLHHQVEMSNLQDTWPFELSVLLIERVLCDEWLSNVAPSFLAMVIFNVVLDHWNPTVFTYETECVDQLFEMLRRTILS